MRLYFAGVENKSFAELLHKNNVKNILQSSFYLRYKHEPNSYGFENLLLDSGGFTAIIKNMPIDLKQYIDFLNKYKVKTAITLDVPDFNKTVSNTYDLKKYTDCKILPVFHDTEYLNIDRRYILDKYCTDFDYICIAGLNRKLLTKDLKKPFGNFIFKTTKDKIKVHGLAVTNEPFMMEWPFYSVDSTSWLGPGQFGKSKIIKNEQLQIYRAKNRDWKERLDFDINYWLNLEKKITNIWSKRGINWID